MKTVVYISGPYTSKLKEVVRNNIAKARGIAVKVWDMGGVALCPHLNTAQFETLSIAHYDDYLIGDMQLLSGCDAIYMLPGWQRSKGAVKELQKARKLGLIILFTEKDLISVIKTPNKYKRCHITKRIRNKSKLVEIGNFLISQEYKEEIEAITNNSMFRSKKFFIMPRI